MEGFMKRFFISIVIALSLWFFLSPIAWSRKPSDEDTLTMALTGDSIITMRLSVYREPEFLNMIELIRSADVAFTNLEMLFHDYEPYPMHESGGTYMRAAPAMAKELAWAGFDMVSRANNHTGDYGVLGMRLTTKYTAEAGLLQAGTGESLAEAREAKFLETAKARVALISCASYFTEHSRAGKSRGDIPARPGLNPLRYSTVHTVTYEELETLRQILERAGLQPPKSGSNLIFYDQNFVAGDKPGVRTTLNQEDLEEITCVVRNASRLADLTIVTIHAHEGDGDISVPARFLPTFARAMIDAGADVLVGHGPHVLRGIEVYKGKPIFYSLGNFIYQNQTLLRLPYENYEHYKLGSNAHVADFNDARYDFGRKGRPVNPEIWKSVIAVPCWRGKELTEIKLYPVSLGFGKFRTKRGRPMFADPDLSKEIIEDLNHLSKPFGTIIDLREGIGVVRLSTGKND
jgi:poly-gamma-glutamate capsule biosynthesis protein CapA/YwtB (metallophosphatase superfamily)